MRFKPSLKSKLWLSLLLIYISLATFIALSVLQAWYGENCDILCLNSEAIAAAVFLWKPAGVLQRGLPTTNLAWNLPVLLVFYALAFYVVGVIIYLISGSSSEERRN